MGTDRSDPGAPPAVTFSPSDLQVTIEGTTLHPCIINMAEALGVPPLHFAYALFLRPHTVGIFKKDPSELQEAPWIPGHVWNWRTWGPKESRIVVIGKNPGPEEVEKLALWVGPTSRWMKRIAEREGLDLGNAYMTNVLKFPTTSKTSTIKKWEQNICMWFLWHELKLVRPRFVLLLGSDATKAVLGKKVNAVRGRVLVEHFDFMPECTFFSTVHPAAIYNRNPALEKGFARDLATFKHLISGKTKTAQPTDYSIIDTKAALSNFVSNMIQGGHRLFAVDCEWGGPRHEQKMRSIQFCWKAGHAAYVNMRDTDFNEVIPLSSVQEAVRKLLCRKGIEVIGQYLRSDDEQIRREFGFSLMYRIRADTTIMDAMVEENRPHDLNSLILRHTGMDLYDYELQEWLQTNKIKVEDEGYKRVPLDILGPYGCGDVDATWRVFFELDKQLTGEPRDLFYGLIMRSQAALAESEQTGFKVDKEQVLQFTKFFNDAADSMELELQEEVERICGLKGFNPRSHPQASKLLFETLGLSPVKTTDDRPWQQVAQMSPKEREAEGISPSADKQTLAVLRKEHPFADMLSRYRTIYTPCSKLFKALEEQPDGTFAPAKKSFLAYVAPDGFIRPRIRDTLKTGRRATSDPNLQNLPERRMELYRKILGNNDIPSVRTIVIAPEHWVLVGADYSQAELFAMAFIAEDNNLRAVLEDPNRDLHAEQAIRQYHLPYDPMCGINPKVWCKEHGYSSFRDHAKTTDFGWAYQISAQGLHMQLTEAGVVCTVEACQEWLDMLNNTFPKTAAFFREQRGKVYDPGYVITPWGRVKHLYPVDDPQLQGHQEREAANFPIQCVSGNSLVLTENGHEKISDLVGKWINVFNGKQFVPAVATGPKLKKRWEMQFSDGLEIVTSPQHRFLIYDEGSNDIVEKEAKDVHAGDWAVDCVADALQGYQIITDVPTQSRRNAVKGNYTPVTALTLPAELSPEIAYLIGAILGDGSFQPKRRGKTKNPYCVLCTQDTDYKNAIVELAYSVFGARASTTRDKKGTWSIHFSWSLFLQYLGRLGLKHATYERKMLPPWALSAPREVRLSIIAGLLDAEGGLAYRTVNFTNTSRELTKQFALLCRSCGIACSMRGPYKNGRYKPFYRAVIRGTSIALARKHIPCLLLRIPDQGAKDIMRTPPALIKRAGRLFYTQKYRHAFSRLELAGITNTMIDHGLSSRQRLLDFYERTEQHEPLMDFKFKQVTSSNAGDGEEEMYDISVLEGDPYFACNGVLVHNSTIGDLLRAAMVAFMKERGRLGVRAKLCPDQHDALYTYVHVRDLRCVLERVLPAAMGITVPKIDMRLDYETNVYLRWGEHPTEDALIRHGVEPALATKLSRS